MMYKFKNNQGYLLFSTLSLLILSSLFLQAMIKINANQIIQLKQFSSAYEYKTALNLAEIKLKDFIVNYEEEEAVEGYIETSKGKVKITNMNETEYQLVIDANNGSKYMKKVILKFEEIEEELGEQEELEEQEEELEESEKELEEPRKIREVENKN